MKRQNKGRWMERWIVILRLKVMGRWIGKGRRKVGESVIIKIKKKTNVKKSKGKLEIKMIMMWMLMWLNWSATIINTIL